MKKILVTGSTGFIGRYVTNLLLDKGYHVIATSSDMKKARQADWFNRVSYVELDLASFDDTLNYYEFFARPDIMIHLAWEGLPNYSNDYHVKENLPRHQAFIRNMVSNGLQDLTVTGTCFEYGMLNGCLSENMDVNPTNPYGMAKNRLREFIAQLSTEFGFSFKWARLFYMFGEGQHPMSLVSQLEEALRDNHKTFNMSGGMQVRDFMPVTDVADRIVRIALQKEIQGVINCCSGKPTTVKQFVEDYIASKNKSIELNLGYYDYAPYEPMEFWGDDSRLKSITG
jgi:dTDP-6-deoxy-L-talose 4-dehydrogenase (NAD+)